MPIYARNRSGNFVPPPPGMQYCICCDIVDLGMVHSERFGKTQHKVQIRHQSENEMKDGKPFLIVSTYTLSLHPKAALRGDIESWIGRGLSNEEASQFDLETLIDKVSQINIVHKKSDDGTRTFGNVASINPPGKHAPKMKVRDYERVCMREGYKAPAPDPLETDQSEDETPHSSEDPGWPPVDREPVPF
jgi:hypothetical protein